MLSIEQAKKELDHKYILLDTCFVIKARQYVDTDFFGGLFSLLQQSNCTPVINEFIRFEFLRGCKTKEQIRAKVDFLNALSGFVMPIDKEVLEKAIDISNIYSNKGIDMKQMSRVDCYLSSYLSKYSRNLFLVTLNHADFPLSIHDRFFVYTIDAGKEILTIGFYKFNTEHFQSILKDIK